MAFRLVNKHRMLAPGQCVICQRVPGQRVVDTGFNLMGVPVAHMLRGRKYLCEGCVEKSGKALGMPTQARFEETLQQLIDAKNETIEARALADKLTETVLILARGEDVLDESFVATLEDKDSDPT